MQFEQVCTELLFRALRLLLGGDHQNVLVCSALSQHLVFRIIHGQVEVSVEGSEKALQKVCVYRLTHSALADAEVPPVDILTTKCFSETSEHAFQCSFVVPKCGSVKILHIRFHVILERIEQWVVDVAVNVSIGALLDLFDIHKLPRIVQTLV